MSKKPVPRRLAASLGALVWAIPAASAPLTLYDNARDSTQLAPLGPPAATGCGDLAAACSAAPSAPKTTTLPFDYGLAVSGAVGGSRYGAFSGESISGWLKPKDIPVTLYFDYERFQPLGRQH